MGAGVLACAAVSGFLLLALRRANDASRAAACTSPAVPTVVDELAGAGTETETVDAGPPASSIVEASARMLAWKPPLATGLPSRGDQKAALPIHGGDHYLGSHKAQVTLMLFGDLRCPFTLRTLKTLRTLLDERPAALRLVWRERPLDVHTGAANAALVAERIALRYGQAAFWRFIVALSELEHVASDAELSELEASLQAGKPRLDEPTANNRATAKLESDRLVAFTYAVAETPTLFVNGWRLNGEVSRSHLEQLVRDEEHEVNALLDESAPASQLYSIRVDANLLDWVRD